MSFNFPSLKISYVKSLDTDGVMCKEGIFLVTKLKERLSMGLPSEEEPEANF